MARALIHSSRTRPRQLHLRQGITNAYYAVFELLVDAGARQVAPEKLRGLRATVARCFEHKHMKQTCRAFASSTAQGPWRSQVPRVPPDLVDVAAAFADLQEARHRADYDPQRRWKKTQAEAYLELAENAFRAWDRVRATTEAQTFLLALLLKGRAT